MPSLEYFDLGIIFLVMESNDTTIITEFTLLILLVSPQPYIVRGLVVFFCSHGLGNARQVLFPRRRKIPEFQFRALMTKYLLQ